MGLKPGLVEHRDRRAIEFDRHSEGVGVNLAVVAQFLMKY
jgi:hypothetical protein